MVTIVLQANTRLLVVWSHRISFELVLLTWRYDHYCWHVLVLLLPALLLMLKRPSPIDQILHLLVLTLNVVFNLFGELFKSIDEVICRIGVLGLGELWHWLGGIRMGRGVSFVVLFFGRRQRRLLVIVDIGRGVLVKARSKACLRNRPLLLLLLFFDVFCDIQLRDHHLLAVLQNTGQTRVNRHFTRSRFHILLFWRRHLLI